VTSPRAATTPAEPRGDDVRRVATEPGEAALRLHAFYGGKLQTLPKCVVGGLDDRLTGDGPEPCGWEQWSRTIFGLSHGTT
jgi:hypothetical protein